MSADVGSAAGLDLAWTSAKGQGQIFSGNMMAPRFTDGLGAKTRWQQVRRKKGWMQLKGYGNSGDWIPQPIALGVPIRYFCSQTLEPRVSMFRGTSCHWVMDIVFDWTESARQVRERQRNIYAIVVWSLFRHVMPATNWYYSTACLASLFHI